MMMGFACALCIAAAGILAYIVDRYSSMSGWLAFGVSWVAVMLIAAGLQLKERARRGTLAFNITKLVGFLSALVVLYPAVMRFPDVWRASTGVAAKALLVWLVLLTLMLLSVIGQMGEGPES